MSRREDEVALAFDDGSADGRQQLPGDLAAPARRTQQEARAGRLRLMARDPQIKARALATEQAIESGSPPPDRAAVDSLRSGDLGRETRASFTSSRIEASFNRGWMTNETVSCEDR